MAGNLKCKGRVVSSVQIKVHENPSDDSKVICDVKWT
jgi:hypothetical protein